MHIHHTIFETLDSDLRRFWKVEEIPRRSHLSVEEQKCDEHFSQTHTRASDGRYVVRLSFWNDPPIRLGEFRFVALSSLQHIEQYFKNHSGIKIGRKTRYLGTDSMKSDFNDSSELLRLKMSQIKNKKPLHVKNCRFLQEYEQMRKN